MTDDPLPGAGLPQDRLARLAARQAFVELKQDFMCVAAGLRGVRGAWLRERVRRAEEPATLFALRRTLFDAVAGNVPDDPSLRDTLPSSLESLFGDIEPAEPATCLWTQEPAPHPFVQAAQGA